MPEVRIESIFGQNPLYMDTATKKKYNYWQWRTLVALIIGYIFYYFLRKNFSAAIPAMEETLGITKVQLGIFLSLNGIVYGISRFVRSEEHTSELQSQR